MKENKRKSNKYYKTKIEIRKVIVSLQKYRKELRKARKIKKIKHEGRDLLGIYNQKRGIRASKTRIKFLKNPKKYKIIIFSGIKFIKPFKKAQIIKIGNKVYTNKQMIKKFF